MEGILNQKEKEAVKKKLLNVYTYFLNCSFHMLQQTPDDDLGVFSPKKPDIKFLGVYRLPMNHRFF